MEVSRPLMLPKDASITPMQAGVAFNALSSTPKISGPFEAIVPPHRPARTWESVTITDDMFPVRAAAFRIRRGSRCSRLADRGFSPKELTYLRAVAGAPVWKDFMTVARAPAVDLVGGRLKTAISRGSELVELAERVVSGPQGGRERGDRSGGVLHVHQST